MNIRDAVRRSINILLGEFRWRPPEWLRVTGEGIARRPVVFTVTLLLVLAATIGGWQAWVEWKNRPQPLLTDWIVRAPSLPPLDGTFFPQPVCITFDRSIASMEQLDKPSLTGVTLSPAMPGTWRWNGGSTLCFEPKRDWPAGTRYTVTLSRQLFSAQARIALLTKSFTTPPFTAGISDEVFYIDPRNPATKQVTATFTFSHPVDHDSLQQSLQVAVTGTESVLAENEAPFTLSYDNHDRVVYYRSADITLPNVSTFLRLTLSGSIKAADGGATLSQETHGDVMIPSEYDLFHITSAAVVIVRDKNAEPSQALVLTTSAGLDPKVLNGHIHAYILPPRLDHEHHPLLWNGPSEIDGKILAQAQEADLVPIPTDRSFVSTASFRLKAPEKAQIYIAVGKGITALGGFPMRDDYGAVVSVPAYEREVRLMYDGSLLALNGDRKLSVATRGVDEIEYRLARVNPGEINHLVSQSEGSFSSPIFYNEFDETDLAEMSVRRSSILNSNASERNYSALDLSEFVNEADANKGKLGLFILRAYGRRAGHSPGYYQTSGDVVADMDDLPAEKRHPEDNSTLLCDRRMILVTDMGLIVKDNADATHDVFVQSIKTGEPVSGAKVSVLGKNGLPLLSVQTDAGGRAAIPSLASFDHEKRPVAYVAQLRSDVSFLPFGREDRELNLSRFDTSGLQCVKPDDLTAFLFTERGIYRPGETVHMGLIVKQHDWRGNLAGIPLELDVTDPRGQQIATRVIASDATGLMESPIDTRETSLTGDYQADLYLVRGPEDKTLLGNTSFKVKEFLPDRLKITAAWVGSAPEGWIAQKGLRAQIQLRNLYGSAAAGHRIKGKLTLLPSQFGFQKYPDYNFKDPYLEVNPARESYTVDLPEQNTNDDGEATFALDGTGLQPSAYRLSFLAEGFEKEGGRSVTAYADTLVSPSSWLLGTKPDGDFNYISLGAKRNVRLLAVEPGLKPIAADHLQLKLVERHEVSVLEQQSNGNYAYESVLKESIVDQSEISVASGGTDWPLETQSPGDFAARFYDQQGNLMAEVRYSVAGAGNLRRALEKNAELTAKLSKPEYNAGEEIEVQITAPYTGAGLMTIERDHVYAAQWFKAASTSSLQRIKIPAGFEGNGYLNIAFVRSLDSKEVYISPLSYAVLPFKVNQEARHTQITIGAPPVVVPGQTMTWTVTANRPTKAIVYAVDEGILQVAGYQLPDPLAYFFRKEALGVGTRQTVDQILPEYSIAKELAATGGDSGQDLLTHHLNPFKRKHDAPVVYWSAIVDLGPQAKSFSYQVPDYFAGTLHIMVVAASPEAVGSAETKVAVRGPFVISPNVPAFLAPGDTFDLSATLANNVVGSGPDAAINASLRVTDGLEIVQQPAARLTISEGRDASVHWVLRAKNVLGNADITVTAQSGVSTSSLVSHLSIRPPVAYFTTLEAGYFKGSEKRVDLTRKVYPQFAANSVTTSIVPQGFSRGLGQYLEHYEYGCTEQLISKAFPTLISNREMQQGLAPGEVQDHLDSIYGVLASRQNDQGAFGYWEADPDVHFDLPSLWGTQLLTEAKERGYSVPSTMLTRALDHLRQMAQEQPATFQQARNQAEAIYLLTRNGVVTTNFVEHTRQWFQDNAKDTWTNDSAGAYLAASYAILKNQKQADALIAPFQLAGAKLQAEDDFYNELGRDSIYIDILAHHFPDRLQKLHSADLMALANPIMDGEYTTLSAAQAILALDDYTRATNADDSTSAHVTVDSLRGNERKPVALTGGVYPTGNPGLNPDALLFHHPEPPSVGLPGLFYQVVQSGFDDHNVSQPFAEGMEVAREYHDAQGNVAATVKLGDELNVVLRVRGVGNREVTNVAILDLLPGGFEVVPESISTGACHYDGLNYADVREDRVAVFGDIDNAGTTITYRIKATNKGTYVVPPPQAEAMYHLKIRARGVTGALTVTD